MKHFSPLLRITMILLALSLGRSYALAQYYPPAVSVSGFDANPVNLYGGGGQYSGSFSFTYSYDTSVNDGYWDYTSYGHWETQDQGYWDTSPGHYEDQGFLDNSAGYTDSDGNWVSQPSWVPNYVWVSDPANWISNPVSVYIYDPSWVTTGSTTNTVTGTATATLTVQIASNGSTSICYNDSLSTTTNILGYYDFAAGVFSSGSNVVAINTDGSTWEPPPPPPTSASFGPPAIWVEGQCYSWAYTEFSDSAMTAGTDYYAYGSGPQVWFRSSNGSSSNEVGGYTSSNHYWTGTATNGVFENTGGVDVRSADLSGGYIQGTAPDGLPPAVRVDGSGLLWRFIGQGASLYHYAGDDSNERLTIDASTGIVTMLDDGSGGVYKNSVIWTANAARDIRAASLDGSLFQNNVRSPSWGPPDVYVSGTIWRYVGTWDGTTSFSGTSPLTGDHYLGENAKQRLVVEANGDVTVFNGPESTLTGSYAPQGQQPGEPRIFSIPGNQGPVFPGDENGVYHNTQPAIGPPAVWVNETLYSFSGSNEDAGNLGSWVDTYMDGANNFLLMGADGVRSFRRSGTGITSDWSGYYIPAEPSYDGGIFVVVNGSPRYDVRAAAERGSLLTPERDPLNGHPLVVKVDGGIWKFAGSSTDTDYYFGANAGERLWIDASGSVSFTNTLNSPNLAGSGNFVGSIFLVQGHDVRACTSDGLAVFPNDSPHYGPAALWVEGVIWSYIGSVSDDDLQVHADFYGGPNATQIIRLNSDMSVSGAYTGVFDGGVFVVNGKGDVRALDSNHAQIPAIGSPSSNSHPGNLRIGGLHWTFVGTSGGVDYYASALGGQRLSIDANGSVYYSDRPHLVNNATGSFTGGVFTATSGGLGFNAGTIGNDLDILGNNLSFGSLLGNSQTAGVTMQFSDNGAIASMQNSLARSQARWGWNRLASEGASTGLPVMQLDTQGRLNLYDPETASTPQIEPTISLAPGIEGGVQVSKLPKLELSQQGLDSDNSVLTKGLADSRYIISAGDGQSLNTLSVTGSASLTNASVSGSLMVANSKVVTESSGDSRYLKVSNSEPVRIANGATIAGATQVNGEFNTTGNLISNANADFKGNVVVESNFTVRGAFVGPPTDRKVIMQSGKNLLIPESGDISMGSYRAGPLPEAVTSP